VRRIAAIADRVHPAFPEDLAVFAERQALYPWGVHLLEVDGEAAGYLIAHPWPSGSAPKLNGLLHHIPAGADSFYLHDLALLPNARGTGAARAIVESMADHARQAGYACMSLVAVNGSVPFWQHLGFRVEERPELAGTLLLYEEAARFMVRPLPPPDAIDA
jgi:GNAT superfamily N-acetyltransferase